VPPLLWLGESRLMAHQPMPPAKGTSRRWSTLLFGRHMMGSPAYVLVKASVGDMQEIIT
jgi:hypothetical protein